MKINFLYLDADTNQKSGNNWVRGDDMERKIALMVINKRLYESGLIDLDTKEKIDIEIQKKYREIPLIDCSL